MALLKHLRQLFTPAKSEAALPKLPALDHPKLGHLVPDEKFADTLAGQLSCGGSVVRLSVAADGRPIHEALDLACSAWANLEILDDRCRQLIAKESLDGYNSDWRVGERVLPTGRRERFENPVLTSEQFRARLVFQTLEVAGSSVLTFRYGDDDMFGGHWLSVTSFDGVALEDINVALEG